MSTKLLESILSLAGVGALIFAFVEGNPAWIGAGGALLGGDLLTRARSEVKSVA